MTGQGGRGRRSQKRSSQPDVQHGMPLAPRPVCRLQSEPTDATLPTTHNDQGGFSSSNVHDEASCRYATRPIPAGLPCLMKPSYISRPVSSRQPRNLPHRAVVKRMIRTHNIRLTLDVMHMVVAVLIMCNPLLHYQDRIAARPTSFCCTPNQRRLHPKERVERRLMQLLLPALLQSQRLQPQ